MVQGKVEICGVNTAKLPLLKNAEKEELFKKIGDGDDAARKEYIKGNLRLGYGEYQSLPFFKRYRL